MSLLLLTSALFCVGLYGVLTRRDLVAVLAAVEVMLGAGTIQLAAFSTTLVTTGASASAAAAGQGYTLAILVLAAAEAAVGLALLVVLVRAGRTRTDQIEEVRG